MPEIASASTHWYLGADCEIGKTGDPCYTLIGKNGKERAVTLADAKRNPEWKLSPSVTTITKLLAAPALVNWIVNESIMAALTLPRHEGELDEEFLERVRSDGKERAKKAAERGTALHTDIERAIQGKPHTQHQRHVQSVAVAMSGAGLELFAGEAEHSFAHPEGFGGKVDYHWENWTVDFKSKPTIEDGKKMVWDEHPMQIAAYAWGLGIENPRGANIFVGIDDAKAVFIEHTPEEMSRGLAMFKLLLNLWKLKVNWKEP